MFYTFTKERYPSIKYWPIVVNLANIDGFHIEIGDRGPEGDEKYRLVFINIEQKIYFSDQNDAAKALNDMTEILVNNKKIDLTANNDEKINITEKMNNTNTVTSDIKNFIKEHRYVIYWTVFALIVDGLFLNGQFTTKIKNIIQTLLNKAEESITGKSTKNIEQTELKQ